MTIKIPFQADVFQHTTFQTVESAYVYPNDLVWLSLTINGVEFGDYLDLEKAKPKITSVLTHQYDECAFKLFDVPPSVQIINFQDIVIKDSDSKIFAGVIQKAVPSISGIYSLDWNITCLDYSKLLETKTVNRTKYTNQTDAYIVNDLLSEYLPEIDSVDFVNEIQTLTSFQVSMGSPKDALDTLAGIVGADYYIDYDKKLHWFSSEEISAGFTFSDEPDLETSFPYVSLNKVDDGSDIFNVVEIIGGFKSADETIYLAGTGLSNRILLPFKYSAPDGQTNIQVWRNDGTQAVPVWTALTVMKGYVDAITLSSEVLHYENDGVIEQVSSWPALSNAVKLTGKYSLPLRTQVRDQASIDYFGREIKRFLFDQNIIDKTVGQLKGKQMLLESSMGKQTYNIRAQKRGVRSGITLSVKNSIFDIDTPFLVQRSIMTIGIGGDVEVEAQIGQYNKDLVDVMIALKKAYLSSSAQREDAVLDVLLSVNEEVEISDETITVSRRAGAYNKYDDGSNWGFAKWG